MIQCSDVYELYNIMPGGMCLPSINQHVSFNYRDITLILLKRPYNLEQAKKKKNRK